MSETYNSERRHLVQSASETRSVRPLDVGTGKGEIVAEVFLDRAPGPNPLLVEILTATPICVVLSGALRLRRL